MERGEFFFKKDCREFVEWEEGEGEELGFDEPGDSSAWGRVSSRTRREAACRRRARGRTPPARPPHAPSCRCTLPCTSGPSSCPACTLPTSAPNTTKRNENSTTEKKKTTNRKSKEQIADYQPWSPQARAETPIPRSRSTPQQTSQLAPYSPTESLHELYTGTVLFNDSPAIA